MMGRLWGGNAPHPGDDDTSDEEEGDRRNVDRDGVD
jgi:hypothetical protein